MKESTLVGFAQSGEEWALAELYRRYARAAFKSAYLMLGSRPLAEDALQETFVQVIRKIRTLREPDRFRPWLWRILTREVGRMKRKSVWSTWSHAPLRGGVVHAYPDLAVSDLPQRPSGATRIMSTSKWI